MSAYLHEISKISASMQGKLSDSLPAQASQLNQLFAETSTLADKSVILSTTQVWPLAVHAFAAVFCMGCSATYHLLHVRCLNTFKILIRLDYGGITVLIFGSCVPILWYCFACDSTRSKPFFL